MNSSIQRLISKLKGAEERLIDSADAKPNYFSSLEKVAKTIGASSREPKESTIKLAREQWLQISDGEYSNVPVRYLRVLCGVTEIASSQQFLEVMEKQVEILSQTALRDLLGVYFETWSAPHPNERFERFLDMALKQFASGRRQIEIWQQHRELLIGGPAPQILANKLGFELETIDAFFQRLQLPRKYAKFSSAVAEKLAPVIIGKLAAEIKPSSDLIGYIFDYLLKIPSLTKKQLDQTVGDLILVLDKFRHGVEADERRQTLTEFLIQHPKFGDPRIESALWQNVSPKAIKTFLSWLAEEDVALFFEIIIQNDPHNRKPYWLRYVKAVVNSVVIVGEDDYKLHKGELDGLARDGSFFKKGYGIKTSAFVLDFGNTVIVEFSQTGNACYVYDRSQIPDLMTFSQAGWKDLKTLKKREAAKHVQRHGPNWQSSLDEKLLEFGVESNDG